MGQIRKNKMICVGLVMVKIGKKYKVKKFVNLVISRNRKMEKYVFHENLLIWCKSCNEQKWKK